MPTGSKDARFLRRMVGMMLGGAFALLVGILLDTPE